MNFNKIEVSESPVKTVEQLSPEITPEFIWDINAAEIGENNRVKGFEFYYTRLFFRIKMLWMLIRITKNPIKVYQIKKRFVRLRSYHLGKNKITKLVKSGNKYYFDLHTPGFPSSAMRKFVLGEINRLFPLYRGRYDFKTVIMGITRKCPLRCAHCFEWDALDGKEKLSLPDLKKIVGILQEKGVAQIQISGGEPMSRLDDLLELISSAKPGTEFLILTSGYNLTAENARRLKSAGVAGITVALDHFDSQKNNLIKRSPYAFQWAMEAIQSAHKAGLMVSLSLCASKDFVTPQTMMKYMEMAKKLGVAFVHILEPRAVGKNRPSDIELSPEQEKILEDLYLNMNFQKKFKNMPIITYHGYHQRHSVCFGAGDRYLYIDTEGDIHACPFCRTKTGNILGTDLVEIIHRLKNKGCHKYKTFKN